ncbi:MAG: glycosyltransferase, partial [Gemmatimonadota bacterium]
GRYDLVLEKGWLLSGYVSARFRRHGVPAIPVENLVPRRASVSAPGPIARSRHRVARRLAGRLLGGAPTIVVETEPLGRAMTALWGVDPRRIEVIELGVDPGAFRPGDRVAARRALGLDPHGLLFVYVGVLDRTHDLGPVFEGLAAARRRFRLLIVGDGPLRGEYEAAVRRLGLADRVEFHGRVAHDRVPAYLAAADLCLAPYDPDAFFGGEVGYSTLKIREYLAAGRPVASIASGSILDLVEEGETGFLVPHDPAAWGALFRALPDRERLHAMGDAAARRPIRIWDDVARDFLGVCRREVARAASGARRPR